MSGISQTQNRRIWGAAPQVLFASAAILLFFLTVAHPESIAPLDPNSANTRHANLLAYQKDIIEQALALEPGRLMQAGKIESAVQKAKHLAASKPYDLLSILCAGNVLCQAGFEEDGFRLLKTAVALAPHSRYVRINLADRLAERKRYDEAIMQYNLIIQGSPRWAKPHLALADIYLSTNRDGEAANELKMLLEIEPNNGEIRILRGLVLARSGQPQKGLEEYVRGNADELNFSGLPADVRQSAESWGSLDRAIYQYRHELESSPDDPLIKLKLARILMYTGQIIEARTLLTEAKKQAPYNADIHRNLALVLQKLGDSNDALPEFMLSINQEKAARKGKLGQP